MNGIDPVSSQDLDVSARRFAKKSERLSPLPHAASRNAAEDMAHFALDRSFQTLPRSEKRSPRCGPRRPFGENWASTRPVEGLDGVSVSLGGMLQLIGS